MFPNTKVSHLTRAGSDHTPILLDTNPESKRLHKPFRCIRSWQSHPTLKSMVEASWINHSSNSHIKNFVSTLKSLSSDLTRWNYDVFGNIHKNIKTLSRKIDNIHNSGNIASKIDILKTLQVELGKWYKIKNDYYHQLSRIIFLRNTINTPNSSMLPLQIGKKLMQFIISENHLGSGFLTEIKSIHS